MMLKDCLVLIAKCYKNGVMITSVNMINYSVVYWLFYTAVCYHLSVMVCYSAV